MKNKMIKLLFLFMLTGAMLVGCGGSETGAETGANNGSSTSTNTEANVDTEKDTQVDVAAKIDPNLEYTETQIAYLFANEEDKDLSLADGKEIEIKKSSVDYPAYIVKVKDTINLYNIMKEKVGYTKTNVECEYVQFSEEWGAIGSIDYSELYFVKTEEALPLIEIIEDKNATTDDEEDNAVVMSDRAKAFFDEVRKGIAEVNANNAALKAEHPEYTYVEIMEADSPDGLELIATLIPSLDYDVELSVRSTIANITEGGHSQYYFEYITEKESPDPELGTYVEFKLYAK